MNPLTPQEQKKADKRIKFIANAPLATFEGVETVLDVLENTNERVSKIEEVVTQGLASVQEELKKKLELDFQIDPESIRGTPGKDYVLTDEDKMEIALAIDVPVAERIIEKTTEVVRELPVVHETIKETIVEPPVTPVELRDKLSSLEGDARFSAKHVKDLPQFFERVIEQHGAQFGETIITAGSGVTVTKDVFGKWVITATGSGAGVTILTATGTIDDSNRDFTFTEKPTEIVVNNGSYIENEGWTWSGLTATLQDNPGAVGEGGRIYGRK